MRTLRATIEHARVCRAIVRVHYGDSVTGTSRIEERGTVGIIAKAGDVTRVELVTLDRKRYDAIDLAYEDIVAIQNATTLEWLYRHEVFNVPHMEIKRSNSFYPWAVVSGERGEGLGVQPSFRTYPEAALYIAFMHGLTSQYPYSPD